MRAFPRRPSARRAAVPKQLRRPATAAINRYILPAGPRQLSLLLLWPGRYGTDRRTDGRTPGRCIDPTPHRPTMQPVPINAFLVSMTVLTNHVQDGFVRASVHGVNGP